MIGLNCITSFLRTNTELLGDDTARHACSVVRDSRIQCPHDIGQDSWVWGEQETLWMMNSRQMCGRKPSPGGAPCREEAERPTSKIVVVVVIVVFVVVVVVVGLRPETNQTLFYTG